MYILTNFNITDQTPLQFDTKDGKVSFTKEIDNIKIVGTEKAFDCNFFVIESEEDTSEDISTVNNVHRSNTEDKILYLNNIRQCKVLECEVVYETGIVQEFSDSTGPMSSFSSKKEIERIKNLKTDGYLKNPTKRVENKSQILPKVQSSTKLIDAFSLEDMFSVEIIESFNNINIEEIELLDITKRFYDGKASKRLRILLLDGLLKLLNFKYVTVDVFESSPYKRLVPLFIDQIENRRLPKLFRDKTIIKIYILILQLEDGRVKLSCVPSFNQKVETVLEYFKVLGCQYNKNTDEIKLVNRPMEYSTKYI